MNNIVICKDNINFLGEPEAVTQLVGRGLGRNHELLPKSENEIVIGVEANANEPLGKHINKELLGDVSANKRNRIE